MIPWTVIKLRMKLLIVEDARDQRMMLSAILRKKGHQVLEAEDGLTALALLETHRDIRIVISDWVMPEMDGIDLCKAIRNNNLGRYLYFILLTGKTERQSLVEGINAGADDFVSKPVNFNELDARLNSGIRIVELERDLENKNQALSDAIKTIEQDLESAAQMQESLLAQPATLNNVTFDWLFKPSKHLGGDMFGYHALGDSHVCFYQLDVAGHGIPSALFSFTLNNILSETGDNALHRDLSSEATFGTVDVAPEQVLSLLNDRFQASAEHMLYFTIAYGILNTVTGGVSVSQAGHPNPFWLQRQCKTVKRVAGKGVPIGMMPDQCYESVTFQLAPGDRLFLYSDGITECENASGEQFGEHRLEQVLSSTFDDPLSRSITVIDQTIRSWNQQDAFDDDLTYLVLEWNP